MTEDEAKTKMCFRAATFGASQQLADGPGPHCIGSACMAWRWGQKEWAETKVWYCDDRDALKEPTRPLDVPADASFRPSHYDNEARWVESSNSVALRQEEMDAHPPGFCGQAGQP